MATWHKCSDSPVFGESGYGVCLTSAFGTRNDPITGKSSYHNGVDILLAPKNGQSSACTITAMGDGTVTAVKTCVPGKDTKTHTAGNYVFIDHGNGLVSKYMHLRYGSVNVKKGDKVKGNQSIGYMGTTGYSTGVHLHFQVEKNGKAVDALPYALGDSTIASTGVFTGGMADPYDENVGAGYQPSVDEIFASTNSNITDSEFVKMKNIGGVFGLPYQFLPLTDVRLDGSKTTANIGYEYGERIIERIPLLFIAPGKASFMTRYSKKNKQNVIEKLLNNSVDNDSNKTELQDLLDGKSGRYYTFEYESKRYYQFVNPMCRIAARYMNLQNVTVGGTKLDMFNWEQYTQKGIKSIGDFGTFTSVPFYVDADTSITESMSNSTGQSQLASTVNSVSDTAKELNFLLGYGAGGKNMGEAVQDSEILQGVENVANMASKLIGTGGFFSNLKDHLVTVASGGKLVFPEIWSNSSFFRDYSCKFKFISPDPSNLSVYLNVLVPLFHLIGLVAPQMPENNPNGYINPFLIRAVYKGFFNVDMGIITSMSVNKGADCQWTPEGVPTSIEVDISIKDLYNAMSITSTDNKTWKYDTLNNTALMDYIATLCGVNVYKPEVARIIDLWYTNNFANRVTDFFEVDIWRGVQNKVQNAIMGIFR